MPGNQHFILPPDPEPGDDRPRNAFGYLTGFGEAAKVKTDRDELLAACEAALGNARGWRAMMRRAVKAAKGGA